MTIALFWPLIESRIFSVDGYIQDIEPYSGLSPDDFGNYKRNLYMFREKLYSEPIKARIHLGNAIDSAREMTLCTRTADSTVQESLDAKIDEIHDLLVKRIPR
jgi:hypothetical protein